MGVIVSALLLLINFLVGVAVSNLIFGVKTQLIIGALGIPIAVGAIGGIVGGVIGSRQAKGEGRLRNLLSGREST